MHICLPYLYSNAFFGLMYTKYPMGKIFTNDMDISLQKRNLTSLSVKELLSTPYIPRLMMS
jgi:hypothetical protein